MKFALDEARNGMDLDEVPVGCVIVKNGELIASSHNLMKSNNNRTDHAEMIAIRKAAAVIGNGFLDECDLYVTLEPCAMCATAISIARIKRLYCGALDKKSGGVYHNSKLFYGNKGLSWIPEHYNGFLADESEFMLKDFFKKKRCDGA
jgi:tRNA(adenine34) deaminase